LPWLTLYAFSLENNLRRPRAEVNFLMRLLRSYLESNLQRMMDNNVRIRYIGRTHELPPEVQDKMAWAAEATARNTGTTLTLALNYGGRSEMVDAFRALAAEMKHKHISPDRITEEDIHRHLYTAHMPDPDLLIRTSGEMRLSNYLLWQIAYTEFLVTERLWPDFRGIHLLEAIADFQRRERRYGGLVKAPAKWKKSRNASPPPYSDNSSFKRPRSFSVRRSALADGSSSAGSTRSSVKGRFLTPRRTPDSDKRYLNTTVGLCLDGGPITSSSSSPFSRRNFEV
jgi:undecaprenyl diphosphate synthase